MYILTLISTGISYVEMDCFFPIKFIFMISSWSELSYLGSYSTANLTYLTTHEWLQSLVLNKKK